MNWTHDSKALVGSSAGIQGAWELTKDEVNTYTVQVRNETMQRVYDRDPTRRRQLASSIKGHAIKLPQMTKWNQVYGRDRKKFDMMLNHGHGQEALCIRGKTNPYNNIKGIRYNF